MENTDQTADIIDVIKEKLKHIGYDYDLLTKKQQKYLIAIEASVSSVFEREKAALEMMSGNNINIKRVAKDIGTTRDTIYNNPVLRDYVDYCANEFKKIDSSAAQADVLEENTRLRVEVAALHSRDVDYEELKLQLADAMNEITRLKQQLELAQNGIGFGLGLQKNEANASKIINLHRQAELRVVSWNVNGFTSCIDKGFFSFFTAIKPDVVCLQETRIDSKKADSLSIKGYDIYWNHANRKGYAGTAIITKIKPIRVINGIGIDNFDSEGRVITAEFDTFYLVNCYSPASQDGMTRLQYRMDFDDALRGYLRMLDATKPVVICGDMNVAHEEIDVETPFPGTIAGISPEERDKFRELLGCGYNDAFRHIYPDKAHVYSWWPYTDYKRSKNTGLRLDYFLISDRMKNKLYDVAYRTDVYGSDHCPVILTMKQ